MATAGVRHGSIALLVIVGVATDNVLLALLPVVIGMSIAIYLSSTISVRCPACHSMLR